MNAKTLELNDRIKVCDVEITDLYAKMKSTKSVA